jgi:hypothetical protein
VEPQPGLWGRRSACEGLQPARRQSRDREGAVCCGDAVGLVGQAFSLRRASARAPKEPRPCGSGVLWGRSRACGAGVQPAKGFSPPAGRAATVRERYILCRRSRVCGAGVQPAKGFSPLAGRAATVRKRCVVGPRGGMWGGASAPQPGFCPAPSEGAHNSHVSRPGLPHPARQSLTM